MSLERLICLLIVELVVFGSIWASHFQFFNIFGELILSMLLFGNIDRWCSTTCVSSFSLLLLSGCVKWSV